MAFEAPLTVKQIVHNLIDGKYVLPAIQREFVWDTGQIEKLFDSLMRGYPINSFLLWEVPPSHVKKYSFYRFLQNYHEKDAKHNPLATLSGANGVSAVLDGQQRMTALFIGLTGSYAAKLPNKRRSNLSAYPQKLLYIDLLNPAGENDYELKYAIKFLGTDEVMENGESYWLEVGEAFRTLNNLNACMMFMAKPAFQNIPQNQREFAAETLSRLCESINVDPVVNYFLEREPSLEKVLQIFIRTNAGGTKLSYSDLLLSIATASWRSVNARQEIHGFVDELNSINDELTFDKDFVLKSCLVLSDIPDIKFKVDNFNSENMALIESKWPKIKTALRSAANLIHGFGYNDKSLISGNAVIPIAYYLYRRDVDHRYLSHTSFAGDRNAIRKWLATVLLRGTFGSMADTILAAIRGVLAVSDPIMFPSEGIGIRLRELNRSTRFSDEEIKSLLDLEYGDRRTFLTLSLVYDDFDYSEKFHIDHIYPRSKLTRRKLCANGVGADDAVLIEERRDNITNLQLLKGERNLEKNDTDFPKWLEKKYPDEVARGYYLATHLLPVDSAFSYSDFLSFEEQREAPIIDHLKSVLG